MFGAYVAALGAAPLSAQTRRTYASKVRRYLVWLAGAEVDGDPLEDDPGGPTTNTLGRSDVPGAPGPTASPLTPTIRPRRLVIPARCQVHDQTLTAG